MIHPKIIKVIESCRNTSQLNIAADWAFGLIKRDRIQIIQLKDLMTAYVQRYSELTRIADTVKTLDN